MIRSNLKDRLHKKIRRSRRNVFVRSDFISVSQDYDQVGRALRQLVKDKVLIKLGYGLYAKSRINPYTGKPMIAAKGGFNQVAKEALKRLDVPYQDMSAIIANDQGVTQVPANAVVQVNKRFDRNIGIPNKYTLKITRN